MSEQEALFLVDRLLQAANRGQKLNDIQSVIFLETCIGRSYREIAAGLGYEHDYIKQVGSHLWRSLSQAVGEPVSKCNIQAVLRRYQQSSLKAIAPDTFSASTINPDWGEAIDVSRFYARQKELQTLKSWILEDCCRWIGIFGFGGIGKTALSVKVAQQVQSEFKCLIWRSLQSAPLLNTLLGEILPILTEESKITEISINVLMAQLRSKRCLLVLDNVESILAGGNRSGQYQSGYEDYQQLFNRIAEEQHQSCLIVTGREKPGRFAVLEGKKLPVRSLLLPGLAAVDANQIMIDKGVEATPNQQQAIVNYFGGNPLAIKMAGTTIQELFEGSTAAFLNQKTTVFSHLRDLLEPQFQRLSPLQQKIMYWLAMQPEPIILAQLQAKTLFQITFSKLLEALESLKSRSWIEIVEGGIIQTPVIIEYVQDRFIQRSSQQRSLCQNCPHFPQ